MPKRITENPFRIRYNVQESAANTYTQTELNLPVTVVGDAVQAIELMAVVESTQLPDIESGQNNNTVVQIVRDSQSDNLTFDNDQLIYQRTRRAVVTTVTAVGEIFDNGDDNATLDMTDHDGNGQIIMERTMFVGINSTGNANVKRSTGYMLAHLVELSAKEVAIQMFLDDQ